MRPGSITRTNLLNRREAARFADISLGMVDKTIEQQVIGVQRGAKRELLLDSEEVAVLWMLARIEIALSVSTKREIRTWLLTEKPYRAERSATLPLGEALFFNWPAEAAVVVREAEKYAEQRDRFVSRDPSIKGGEPVIAGSRVSVYAVAARLAGGDSIENLLDDWPHLERAAIEAADLYARTHPRRGRPASRWPS